MTNEPDPSVEDIAKSMANDPEGWAIIYVSLKETMEMQRVLIDRLESGTLEVTH